MTSRRQFLRLAAGAGTLSALPFAAGFAHARPPVQLDEVAAAPPIHPSLFGSRLAASAPSRDMASRIALVSDAVRETGPWLERTRAFARHGRRDQLELVNRYVNSQPYRTDREAYKAFDYWARPSEFFAKGGDCEDFALAKYVLLRHLGFHPGRLHLTALCRRSDGYGHATLAVTIDGRNLVLDQYEKRIVEDAAYGGGGFDLVYSLCETGLFVPAGRHA